MDAFELIVDWLLEGGEDPEATTRSGLTPLMLAAATGQAKVVSRLLEEAVDSDRAGPRGVTALLLAANHSPTAESSRLALMDPTSTLTHLLADGADVHAANDLGMTSLHVAALC